MKLQALLLALALAGAGSAFAASDTAAADKTPVARHGHRAISGHGKTAKSRHHAPRHAAHTQKGTRHMGASGQYAEPTGARNTPETDLQSRARQSRIDEAYDKWRASGNK